MLEFRYIDMSADVCKYSLQDALENTWLIYPTARSCRQAYQEFQANWKPLNINFISMDDYKQNVIYSPKVRLQDEKRLVCLYQCMTAEDKAIFHIEKYPDIIDWGQHFLAFFEELAEESVDADLLLGRMDNHELDYQPWQYENYRRMLQIRQQYQSFITQKGYTDIIFDLNITNLCLPEGITRYVFVNQFYYSRLEKDIIGILDKKGYKVIVYFQGKENWLDKESLKGKEFRLDDAFTESRLPFELKVVECKTAWQMALAFLNSSDQNRKEVSANHFVIDARFAQQPYHKIFDKEHFRFSEPLLIHKTRLCHFLQILATGLENLVVNNGKKLLKLDWLLQAVGIKGFIEYFRPRWNNLQEDKLIAALCKLSENDILYLDLELSAIKIADFPRLDEDSIAFLADVMALVQKVSAITNICQFVDVIDEAKGIRIKDLLSEDERTSSNLPESFYEALANFMSLDELALVDNWQTLYPLSDVSAGIFDLFMQFIKPKTYRIFQQEPSVPRPVITNLMDTRNLQADKVTFLNLTEGEIPGGRTPVWLFNERQRKEMGLKTWEDVRRWERYYYYRLLASAKEVELYTINNQDKDIEPSSFLNEIQLFAVEKQGIDGIKIEKPEIVAPTLLLNWLKSDNENPLSIAAELPTTNLDAWLNLPYMGIDDFGNQQQINLSWSACEHFIRSSFVYYLRDVKRLKERTMRLDETMNRKMFGNLLHRYLMVITQRLAEQHQGTLSMQWDWINKEFLANNLQHALSAPILTYQIPKNYNWEYIVELLSPFLIDTASWFFRVGLAKDADFQAEYITIIPETERMTEAEKQYKLLLKPEETNCRIGIAIRGRADLRLETKAKRFIIDFKTGESDKLQLLFYIWAYYLIDQPELDGQVRAGIYKLMDKQLKWLDYESKYEPAYLVETLIESLEQIVENGFAPATDARNRRYFIDITRADLLHKLAVEEETE